MPVAIVAIIFGSFLLLMKMILTHRQGTRTLPPVEDNSTMRLSELEAMMTDRVNQAIEPLVSRIDELESMQLLATSEKMLLEEGDNSEKPSSSRAKQQA